jgi:KDO2-lipid IV(A) lauroyltransferase
VERLKTAGIVLLLRLGALLPLSLARRLGRLAALLYWPFRGRSRRVTERNIALAFPGLPPQRRQRLARDSLLATGELIGEMGHVWLRSLDHVRGLVLEVHGARLVTDALAAGRGVICLGPHLGNWEVVGLYLPRLGPALALFEPPKLRGLGPLVRRARERSGATVVPTDARGIATLVRQVRQGGIAGILPDQVPERTGAGANVPFMGVPCFTPTLACRLLRRTGALAVFAFALRVPGGFTLHFLPADDAVYSEDLREALAAMNRGVERCVALAAPQYQWEYKRFRVRPRSGPGVYDDL